jgi:hypothetical protein
MPRQATVHINVEGVPAVVAALKLAEVELVRMGAELARLQPPDPAEGRCQAMVQCHRETGHGGGHEAHEENRDA